MERRIIEDFLPIKEISKEAIFEKNLRHGYISTFHIWWARKPLAVSRAVTYASLVNAPKDPIKREMEKNHIVQLAKWSNSNNFSILNKSKKQILNSNSKKIPKALDPFSGGGSIPLEMLRLGCETFALDYNPVANLILKCTLEFSQKYGNSQTDNEELKTQKPNRLLIDVKKWGNWIFDEVKKDIGKFYPNDPDGNIPVCYMWARTIPCQNPACKKEIPLFSHYLLSKKGQQIQALLPIKSNGKISFKIIDQRESLKKNFTPTKGNVSRAKVTCLLCGYTIDPNTTRELFTTKKANQKLIAVILDKRGTHGKKYRLATERDQHLFQNAEQLLNKKIKYLSKEWAINSIPDEPTPEGNGPGAERAFSIKNYGLDEWGDVFNSRQKLSLITFCEKIRQAYNKIITNEDKDYAKAIVTYLALGLDRLVDYGSTLCMLNSTGGRGVVHTFGRPTLSMAWTYAESNPLNPFGAGWLTACEKNEKWIEHISKINDFATISQGSATALPYQENFFDLIITDPPYYDNVPYSYLSDFFYVWLKRSIGFLYPELFVTPLTAKTKEIVVYGNRVGGLQEGKKFFETNLKKSFTEINRVLKPNGLGVIIYAHKSTAGWETVINSILDSGLVVTAAWPINTEMKARLRSQESAALASSIYMITRKIEKNPHGFYKDIKIQLKEYLSKKLEQLWKEDISGADFFISAIGSAIEVFGKYKKVVDDSDHPISVVTLLDDTRKIVTNYAIQKVLHSEFSDEISQMTRFYILWRWAFGEANVPYDDAIKMAKSTGIDPEHEWNKGFIIKDKEIVRIIGPDERKEEDLEESHELIDVLHHTLILWKKSKKEELNKLLEEKGYSKSDMFKRVAQAISESLPQESTEKKWLDGFLTGFRVDDSTNSQTKLI